MKFDMITFGFPMVEIIRKELDVPFTTHGDFSGPFAAGDSGIFLNACAMQGRRCAYVGVVGADPLAECFLNRMAASKIDTSHIRVDSHRPTGMSLLAKFSDNSRSFVFTLSVSAAASLGLQDLDEELLKNVRWVHISGFALSISESIAELHHQLIKKLSPDVIVSFDPNYRNEMIEVDRYKAICMPIFDRCNLFLPSRGEACLFCQDASDELDACRRIAKLNKQVAWKDGSAGSVGFYNGEECHFSAYPVVEIDSTGAGDTFGGVLAAFMLDGVPFFEAMRYASAAGALCVSRQGLMEAAPTREEVQIFLKCAPDNGEGPI